MAYVEVHFVALIIRFVLAGKLDTFPGKQSQFTILLDEHFVGALHLDFGDEADDELLQVQINIRVRLLVLKLFDLVFILLLLEQLLL